MLSCWQAISAESACSPTKIKIQFDCSFVNRTCFNRNIFHQCYWRKKMHQSSEGPPPKQAEIRLYSYCEQGLKQLKWLATMAFAICCSYVLFSHMCCKFHQCFEIFLINWGFNPKARPKFSRPDHNILRHYTKQTV